MSYLDAFIALEALTPEKRAEVTELAEESGIALDELIAKEAAE